MPIKKILNRSHLQVTFSKRRAGLFKKASELCTLCGVEIAVIVFSPAGKTYSFGHSDVGSIVKKFLATAGHSSAEAPKCHKQITPEAREMNAHLTLVISELEVERKQGELLDQVAKAQQAEYGLSIEGLGPDGLGQLRNALEELKLNVESQKMSVAVAAGYEFDNFVEDWSF
ncbi:Agamous-like MADS-box protein AGL61 [Linum grandiflorum]